MKENEKKEPIEFPCKEPGCPHKVVYEPEEIFYFRTEPVYLTCKEGHTHSYPV